MTEETQKRMERIRGISRVLQGVCKVLLVLVAVVFVVAAGAVLVGGDVAVAANRTRIPVGTFGFSTRLLVAGLIALTMGVIFKGLYHLQCLFGHSAAGDVFTRQSAAQMRKLGITAILWCGVSVAWAIAIVSLHYGQGPFDLRLDALAGGAAMIAISWCIDAAAELRAENELTI